MDSLPRSVPAVQFHNHVPSGTYDIDFCQSYTWPSCHHAPVGLHWPNRVLSKSYDNFMPATFLRVQIRNSMPSRKKSPWKNISHHGYPTKKVLVFSIVIRTQKCIERRFALSALLIVFHCIIWLLIPFHFTALPIAFSK